MSEGLGAPSRKDMERAALRIMVDSGMFEDEAVDIVSGMTDSDLEEYLMDVREERELTLED